MAMLACSPATPRCGRCPGMLESVRVSFVEEPRPTYVMACTSCGWASGPPPYRRISDELWETLLARWRPNPSDDLRLLPKRLVKVVPEPAPLPTSTPQPTVLRPGDLPTCAAGHDRLIFGRLRHEAGKKPVWCCVQCRRDSGDGYASHVPEALRRCKNGHLLMGNSFQKMERGRMVTHCQTCWDVGAARWLAIKKAQREARKAASA